MLLIPLKIKQSASADTWNLKMIEKKRGRPIDDKKPVAVKGFTMPLFKNDIKYLNKIKKATGLNERQCVREAVKFFSENLNN